MLPFNYHHLYYFWAVAKAGSVSKACASLRLAQPTVSLQLKQFETHLGKQLFERVRGRLKLSDEGRLVLDYAEGIFALGKEMQDALSDRLPEGSQALQIGVLSGTPWAFTHALLRSLLQELPRAHVTVLQAGFTELKQLLGQQGIDLALSEMPMNPDERVRFHNRLIARVPVVLAASPGLVFRYKRFPKDFDDAPFILPTSPSQVFGEVQRFLAKSGVAARVVAQVQDVEVARRLAISGFGIVPLNAYTVSVSSPARGLKALPIRLPKSAAEPLYLITRERRRQNPLADKLMRDFKLPKLMGSGLI